jgi:hypothetical protein
MPFCAPRRRCSYRLRLAAGGRGRLLRQSSSREGQRLILEQLYREFPTGTHRSRYRLGRPGASGPFQPGELRRVRMNDGASLLGPDHSTLNGEKSEWRDSAVAEAMLPLRWRAILLQNRELHPVFAHLAAPWRTAFIWLPTATLGCTITAPTLVLASERDFWSCGRPKISGRSRHSEGGKLSSFPRDPFRAPRSTRARQELPHRHDKNLLDE